MIALFRWMNASSFGLCSSVELRQFSKSLRLIALLVLSLSLQSCLSPSPSPSPLAGGKSAENDLDHQKAQALFGKMDLADAAYQQGRWQQAAGLYKAALVSLPEDPYLWFRLGNTLTQQGDYGSAIQAFETSLQHDARQAKPWFNLSTAHLLGAQLATLKAWQAMDPDDPSRTAAGERLNTLTQLLR